MKNSADVAIIGAGPIGIELAVACQQAGIDFLHLEGSQIGYTISWFAPGTRFFSSNDRIGIAGVPLVTSWQEKASREDYLAYLRAVVGQYKLDIHTYHPVVDFARAADGFTLTTDGLKGRHAWRARRVVLATGGTARPRMLNIPGENLPQVSHYFQDPHSYFGQRLLVVGGGNSAVEALLRCHRAGARVSLSYRGADLDARAIKYWLYPEVRGLLREGAIAGYFNSTIKEIRPGAATLINAAGELVNVDADFVLLLTGYEADMSLCRMAGVELRQPGNVPVFNPRTMETNVPGVYVAGTAIAGTQSHYRIFLENCHVHVKEIVAALRGDAPPAVAAPSFEQPET